MRVVLTVIAAWASLAFSTTPSNHSNSFEWPPAQPDVMADLRVSQVLNTARKDARDAQARAQAATRAAAQAHRRAQLRENVGRSPEPLIIDAGTIMRAVPFNGESGPMLGEVQYPSGARMQGLFGPNIGVISAPLESHVVEFRGWVAGADTQSPDPRVGVYSLRNGESFAGCYCAGSNASGIYTSADGAQRFVGKMDLTGPRPRPVQGIVETHEGQLLAVITGV